MSQNWRRRLVLAIASWLFATAVARSEPRGAGFSQVVASPSPTPSTQPVFQPAPDLPPIEYEDVVLLVRNVRSALRDKLAGKSERSAGYHPPALKKLNLILHATLRRDGAAIAEAETKEMNIVDGAVAAGVILGRSILDRKIKLEAGGHDCGLELEWIGPAEYIRATNDDRGKWTDALLHSFEPGIEGISVEIRGRRGWTRPSQIIALNYTPDVAIQAAESKADIKQIDKIHAAAEVKYFRFRTRHVWQARSSIRPLTLTRGTSVIPIEQVDEQGLDQAIERIGRYLRYRQNSDGWFSEEYLPTPDRYTTGNSASVQMRAQYGLAAYASWLGSADRNGAQPPSAVEREESSDAAGESPTSEPARPRAGSRGVSDAAAKGLGRSAAFLTPLLIPKGDPASQPAASQPTSGPTPTTQAGRLLAFPGHEAYLRISADLLSGMLTLPGRPEFDAAQRDLIEALLTSQDEEGRFELQFQARSPDALDDALSAGQAMAALARAYHWRPDPRIERALQRGERYYQGWYQKNGAQTPSTMDRLADPSGSAALAHALCLTYGITNDARTSDLAFSILDRLAALQLTAETTPWSDLYGAFNAHEPGVVGVDTASHLVALSEGLKLAQRVGDAKRTQAYRDAVRSAARFVMQLEMREAGAFYVRGRRDALGGIRKSPWNNEMRADYCAEALVGLINARAAIFSTK